MSKIIVKENEQIDDTLRRFKRQVSRNGTLLEVRKMLGERGIKPETLPPDEDINKVQRRLKSDEKKLIKGKK